MSPRPGRPATLAGPAPLWERPLLGVWLACAAIGASLASDPVVAVLAHPEASHLGRSLRVAPGATWLLLACALACWAQAAARPGVVCGLVSLGVGVLVSFLGWAGEIQLADGQLLLLAGVASLWLWFERARAVGASTPTQSSVPSEPSPGRGKHGRLVGLGGGLVALLLGWVAQADSPLLQRVVALGCVLLAGAVIRGNLRARHGAGIVPHRGPRPVDPMWVPLAAMVWIGFGVGFPSILYVSIATLLVAADRLGLGGGLAGPGASGPGWSDVATDFLLQEGYRAGLEPLWQPGLALIALGALLALASLAPKREFSSWIWRIAAIVSVVIWAREAWVGFSQPSGLVAEGPRGPRADTTILAWGSGRPEASRSSSTPSGIGSCAVAQSPPSVSLH